MSQACNTHLTDGRHGGRAVASSVLCATTTTYLVRRVFCNTWCATLGVGLEYLGCATVLYRTGRYRTVLCGACFGGGSLGVFGGRRIHGRAVARWQSPLSSGLLLLKHPCTTLSSAWLRRAGSNFSAGSRCTARFATARLAGSAQNTDTPGRVTSSTRHALERGDCMPVDGGSG